MRTKRTHRIRFIIGLFNSFEKVWYEGTRKTFNEVPFVVPANWAGEERKLNTFQNYACCDVVEDLFNRCDSNTVFFCIYMIVVVD